MAKAGLERLAGIYASQTEQARLRANIVDPGRLRTAMRAQAYPGEDPKTLPLPDSLTDLLVELAETGSQSHGPAPEGSVPGRRLIVSSQNGLRRESVAPL